MNEIDLLIELIKRPSLTPKDEGCMTLIAERLSALRFSVEYFDKNGVRNAWIHHGSGAPCLVFAGHTDVVPTGDLAAWRYPPFSATIEGDTLYGRGAADMKSGVAAMTMAVHDYVQNNPEHRGQLGLLLTSDEEGPAIDGTRHALEVLSQRGQKLDYCVVAEPSSSERFGDVIRQGRRGSLSAEILIQGRQGHVAYPEQVRNPIHLAAKAIAELSALRLDQGNAHFPASTLQVTNLKAGTGTHNVVPQTLEIWLNIRFNNEHSAQSLQAQILSILGEADLDFSVNWRHSADPFLTADGALIEATRESLAEVADVQTRANTEGGTSDGRFIARHDCEVIELGVKNATIHQIDECVELGDVRLAKLSYQRIIEKLLN